MKAAVTLLLLGAFGAAQLVAEESPNALTLPAAVRLALERNPDLATAQQHLVAARAALRQADAAFYPSLRVSENYAASDNPVQAFMMTLNQKAFNLGADFNHPDTTDNLNTKVLATWSLYNGGRDFAARQSARFGAEERENVIAAVRNDLVFEVTRSFYTIGKARRFVSAAEAGVASMESNLGVASNRFVQGTALKSDLLDADVRLAEARENLVRARSALAMAETIFRNVLGVGERENVTAGDTSLSSVTLSEAKGLSRSGALTTEILPLRGSGLRREAQNDTEGQLDVSHRPELLAARKAVAAAEQQARAASAGHRPRVNAFASYDLDSENARRYEESWVGGVSVELDVFDGFLTQGKVAEARANLSAAREDLRKTELALQLEAKQAQLDLKDARARLDTSSRSVAQAEESLQITKERYGNGLALLTQLLDSETALTAARQRRAAAEADSAIAVAALDKALGGGGKETQ